MFKQGDAIRTKPFDLPAGEVDRWGNRPGIIGQAGQLAVVVNFSDEQRPATALFRPSQVEKATN
jgi:hypothetical protein